MVLENMFNFQFLPYNEWMRLTKKQKRMIVYSILGLLIILLGRIFPAPENQNRTEALERPTPPAVVSTTDGEAQVQVDRIIDGDTIDVLVNGEEKRIRLIGLNTPETKDPRKPVECFGKEASLYITQLLEGKTVRLEADDSQDQQDRYGRLLRYVFVGEMNVNLEMIRQGYGYEYTYERPYRYQAEFKAAQQEALDQKRGLWGIDGCSS